MLVLIYGKGEKKMQEEVVLIYLVIIGLLVVNGFLAKQMANVAAMKGYGEEIHAWAWCFWLGIIGYIYVLSLPDKVTQSQNQQIIELLKTRKENKEND